MGVTTFSVVLLIYCVALIIVMLLVNQALNREHAQFLPKLIEIVELPNKHYRVEYTASFPLSEPGPGFAGLTMTRFQRDFGTVEAADEKTAVLAMGAVLIHQDLKEGRTRNYTNFTVTKLN